METSKKPIEQFFTQCNSGTEMLYEAMPYVNMSFKKPLALFIKMQEMREIMNGFGDSDTLSACGLDEPSHNIEDMLNAMRTKAVGKSANVLNTMLSIMQAGKIYRAYSEVMNHSDISASSHSPSDSQKSESSANGSSDLLSQILPLLIDQSGNSNNSTGDIANIIRNAMKGEQNESKLAQ